MTQPEIDWFYGGGAGRFWPELWEKFSGLIPDDEQGDLIAAYHKRLFSGEPRARSDLCSRLGQLGKRAGFD